MYFLIITHSRPIDKQNHCTLNFLETFQNLSFMYVNGNFHKQKYSFGGLSTIMTSKAYYIKNKLLVQYR